MTDAVSSKYMPHAVIFLLFFTGLARSQPYTEPSRMKQFNITVNFDEYTVKTQMLSGDRHIAVDNARVYMWYASQKIMETKGGFDGKLIHGTYRAFYLNNQLKEKGCIQYGLKNKEWKYWYPDGKLKEVITWKRGVKHGTYLLYNDYGQVMAKGKFRNDKLHGRFMTYGNSGAVLEKKNYKEGDEIIPRKPTPVKPARVKRKKQTAGENENAPAKLKNTRRPFKNLFKKKAGAGSPSGDVKKTA